MATTSAERMRKLRERRAKSGSDEGRHVTASHDVTGDGSDGGTTEGQGLQEKGAPAKTSSTSRVSDAKEALPPGWRPEWSPPKGARARAKKSTAKSGPLPPVPELRDEALRMLREVATDKWSPAIARVAAAKEILEETAPKKLPAPEEGDVGADLESLFGGKSPANAAA